MLSNAVTQWLRVGVGLGKGPGSSPIGDQEKRYLPITEILSNVEVHKSDLRSP